MKRDWEVGRRISRPSSSGLPCTRDVMEAMTTLYLMYPSCCPGPEPIAGNAMSSLFGSTSQEP
eukprot:5694235-Pyramimonas_sp.AAC.1